MRKDKDVAIKLRKSGLSYKQISDKTSIPKSTLSYWLRDIKLSKEATNKIKARIHKTSIEALIKRNKQQTVLAKQKAGKIKKRAKKETSKLMSNKLFIIGVSLYWGEGYKKGAYGSKWKSVDFANSDPEMIQVILKFFEEICNVKKEKIKIQIIAHKNINPKEALNFWSQLTKIPKKQFFKISKPTKYTNAKRINNNLPYGTVHIRINDVKLFFRIIGWIEGLKENI